MSTVLKMRNPDGSPKKAASPSVVPKPKPWTAKMLRKIAIAADEDTEQWLSKYGVVLLHFPGLRLHWRAVLPFGLHLNGREF